MSAIIGCLNFLFFLCLSGEGFFCNSFGHFYQELRDQEKNVREKVVVIEEQVAEHLKQQWRPVTEMTAPGSGRPKSFAFEHQVRTVLASGCSARAAMEQILASARVYLSPEVYSVYELMVPNKRWSTPPNPTYSRMSQALLPNAGPNPLLHPGFSASVKRSAMKRGSVQ